MVIQRSQQHLQAVGKHYWPHGVFAWQAGWWLIYAGMTSLVHAVVPAWFPFVSRDITLRLANQARAQEQAVEQG